MPYPALLHYVFCLPHKYTIIIVKTGIQRSDGITLNNLQYCEAGLDLSMY